MKEEEKSAGEKVEKGRAESDPVGAQQPPRTRRSIQGSWGAKEQINKLNAKTVGLRFIIGIQKFLRIQELMQRCVQTSSKGKKKKGTRAPSSLL